MVEQYHVFISYSQDDGEIAASVASALSDLGLKPFLAEKELGLGVKWEPSLKDALRQSSVILCLVTPKSKTSVWLHAEAGAAWVLDKPILPALFAVDPSELIEILRLHQGRKIDSPERLQSFLRDVAALVSRISVLPLVERTTHPISGNAAAESFTESNAWTNLLKIGTWSRDEATGVILGRGIHNYVLSSNHYTPPFDVRSRLSFHDLHAVSRLDAVNAGIVFGWTTPNNTRRYFNLLLNEKRIWLELIGDRGGDAYHDFQHLDGGIPFQLEAGRTYELWISVEPAKLSLTITGNVSAQWSYVVELGELAHGRVGLRPWRSQVSCELFKVSQL